MTQWWRTHAALAEAEVQFPAPTLCGSKPSVTSTPGDPMPSGDIFGHLYTYAHTHTQVHSKSQILDEY